MATVIDELARWGPESSSRLATSRVEAEAYCLRLARTHYENFPVVSWLLPRSLRQHFANVYAYCRWADDLGDETGDPVRSLELLSWWRDQLHACYAGEVRHPVFVALHETISRFEIPLEPFDDLISAFEQDQHVWRYETFEDLQDYCRRSANPVGRIVLCLCRNVSDRTLHWSDRICTGLQLANFWQDVNRDARRGRVYLPAEDRRRFEYSDADLDQRVTNEAFLELMRFEVERTRDLLSGGRPLVETFRGRMQINIEMFICGGLQILREIERIGFRVWETRPVITKRKLATLFAGCICRAAVRRGGLIRPSSGSGGEPETMLGQGRPKSSRQSRATATRAETGG